MKTTFLYACIFLTSFFIVEGQNKKTKFFTKADFSTMQGDSIDIMWGNVCCVSNDDSFFADSAIMTKALHFTLTGNVRVVTGGRTIIKSQKISFYIPRN